MLDLDQDVSAATTPAELAQAVDWAESGRAWFPVTRRATCSWPRLRDGIASLPPEDLAGMNLSATATPAEHERLVQDIVASHCGHAPDATAACPSTSRAPRWSCTSKRSSAMGRHAPATESR